MKNLAVNMRPLSERNGFDLVYLLVKGRDAIAFLHHTSSVKTNALSRLDR